jgi:hypothetical protein
VGGSQVRRVLFLRASSHHTRVLKLEVTHMARKPMPHATGTAGIIHARVTEPAVLCV